MNRSVLSAGRVLVFLVPLMLAGIVRGQGEGWHETLSEAQAAARRDGLPLLIHFHAWYCGPCRQMESQVFHHGDVQAALRRGLHAVQIDVTQHPEVASRYQAGTVPRDVVVYPDGRTETLHIGFASRTSYLGMLRGVAASVPAAPERGVPLPAEPSGAAVAGRDGDPDASLTESTEADGNGENSERVLGLDGYSPVRLVEQREWVRGQPEISSEYRGVTYYFEDAAQREEFLKDPARYAPQNLGCDPVRLYEDQRAIAGRIEYGAFFDGQLYLFESKENRTAFRSNPLQYTRIRHAVKIGDVEGSRRL